MRLCISNKTNREEFQTFFPISAYSFISVHILAVILKKRYAVNAVNCLEA